MRNYILLFAFSALFLTACGEEEEEPAAPYEGNFLLEIEHQPLCSGESSQIHVIVFETNKEIPVSEVEFKLVDPSDGVISSTGLFTSASGLTDLKLVAVEARFKNGASVVMKNVFTVVPSGSYPGTWVKPASPEIGGGRKYDRFENGDIVMTTVSQFLGSPPNPAYEVIRVSDEGEIVWKRVLGPGFSHSIKVSEDKIYSAGLRNWGTSNLLEDQIVILNSEGQVLKELDFPDVSIGSFTVDKEGQMYVSMSEEFENKLVKLDENGEVLWEKSSPYEFLELQVPEEKYVVGLIRIPDEPDEEGLIFFNSEGEEVWLKRTGKKAGGSRLFLMPSGWIGLASSENLGNEYGIEWRLYFYNTDGSIRPGYEFIHGSYNVNYLVSPSERLKYLGDINEVFVSKTGEVYLLGTASWRNSIRYIDLVMKDNIFKWSWWENVSSNPSLSVTPISISEVEDGLIVMGQRGPGFSSFKIQKDIAFNTCLLNPFWRKDDL